MLDSAFSAVLGFLILFAVVFVSVVERGQTQIQFIDWHAGIVVLGGVCGSLLIALRGTTCLSMIQDWISILIGRDSSRKEMKELRADIVKMETAWKEGRRAEVLGLIDGATSSEVRTAADALVQHLHGHRLHERFEQLRVSCTTQFMPQIEGWDMVARLAPSFGIVGTVAGMIQLFKNMAGNSGNLGGAMGLALLATLYGILLGTAVGGPMSTRMNQFLNERLSVIDLLERQVAALIEEDRNRKQTNSGHHA